jgi:hypothetical protein
MMGTFEDYAEMNIQVSKYSTVWLSGQSLFVSFSLATQPCSSAVFPLPL